MQNPANNIPLRPRGPETRLVIVGGVAAGASAAARARRLSAPARITIVERGPDVSFANCGLPYHVGGEIADRARLAAHTPESLAALLDVTVRTRTEVVSIDRARKILAVRTVAGATEELPYDKLVLAPGASPVRPPLPGIGNPRIHTLRTLGDMDRIKAAATDAKTALIVGAGFIGLEMAEQLHRAGLGVTLVEMTPQVLPQLDPEMTRDIERELRDHDVDLVLGDGVEAFSESAVAPGRVVARLRSGREIAAGIVILSIGVKPENALAAAAGLALGERGAIKVNEWMQTSDPEIYAAGDAVESTDRIFGRPMNLALGGPANRQGRVIADHIFQKTHDAPNLAARPYPGHTGTAIVRVFDTAAGATGWTEKRLRAAGIAHEVTLVTDHQHAAFFPGAMPLTLKLLWSPGDGRVLGAQAFGADGADKRLDVLATAIAARMTIDDLAQLELAYAPPFGSARDVVNTTAFAAQNQRDGLVRPVREFPPGRRLLDVRPRVAAETDPLPGALNIPLSELRSRIRELDTGAGWATVCALGKTSYFAARILSQNGLDAVSLSGGLKIARPPGPAPSHVLPHPQAPSQPGPQTLSRSQTSSHSQAPASAPVNTAPPASAVETLDCTGLSCPGPLLQLKARVAALAPGAELRVTATDPGFARDAAAFCRATGHEFLGVTREKGIVTARLRKPADAALQAAAPAISPASGEPQAADFAARRKGASLVVFSGDMDKVMAALVIANGAAALGGRVTMFFTFWGINALRRAAAPAASGGAPGKSLLDRMFGWLMPRGFAHLPLSRMNFLGIGPRLMRRQMASKNLPNLPGLLGAARLAGVRLVVCTMSMEAMGIRADELIDGVEFGGVADYLDSAEQTGANLFM